MNLIEYVGTKKLNDLIIANPYDPVTLKRDVTLRPDRFTGLLGSEFKLSEKIALKQSNTLVGTLYSCILKAVRIDPAQVGAITTIVPGRPLFWSDTKKFYVVSDATATARLAGIAITNHTSANAKGDIIPIVIA